MEQSTKLRLVNSLMKSPHGELSDYLTSGLSTAIGDSLFYAHFVAYAAKNSQVRDLKVALPIIGMYAFNDPTLVENSMAHLSLLGPRELYKAARYHRQLNARGLSVLTGNGRAFKDTVKAYLRRLERNWDVWDSVTVRSRNAVKGLYAMFHVKPAPRAAAILFEGEYPRDSVFMAVKNLSVMQPKFAAAMIAKHKIPAPIITGAYGRPIDEEILLAMVDSMTPSELINYQAFILRHSEEGSVVRTALHRGLEKAVKDSRVATHKMTRAISAIDDGDVQDRLERVQEKRLDEETLGGRWLILADRSGSMSQAIDAGKELAAIIARHAEQVLLVFFNDVGVTFEVTGKTLKEIKEDTSYIRAGGTTSIGAGVKTLREDGLVVDSILVISDGVENRSPCFQNEYQYLDYEPGVFWLKLGDYANLFYDPEVIDVAAFEVEGMDYYSVAGTLAALRGSRYQLLEDIMSSKLLTMEMVEKIRS